MSTRVSTLKRVLHALMTDPDVDQWESEGISVGQEQFDEDTETVLDSIATMESLIESLVTARRLGYPKDDMKEVSRRLTAFDGSFPSLESFQLFAENTTSVSVEALRQSVREAFKSILMMLARFWAQLSDFVFELSQTTIVLRTRSSLARSYLREIQGLYPKTKTVDIARFLPQLSCEGILADDPIRLANNLAVLEHQLSLVRRQYIPMVLEKAEALTDCFTQWDVDTAEVWLAQLNATVAKFNPAAALGLHTSDKETGVKIGDSLPGYRRVVYREINSPSAHPPAGFTEQVLEWAQFYQQRQVAVEVTSSLQEELSKDITKYDTPVWSQHALEKVLLQVDSLIQEIDRCAKDDARIALRNLTLKLDKLSRSEIEVPDGTTAYFQAGLGYIRAISKWTKEPYMALITRAITLCNGTVRLCNIHTRAYTEMPPQQRESK